MCFKYESTNKEKESSHKNLGYKQDFKKQYKRYIFEKLEFFFNENEVKELHQLSLGLLLDKRVMFLFSLQHVLIAKTFRWRIKGVVHPHQSCFSNFDIVVQRDITERQGF